MSRPQGPNVRRLIALRISRLAVPKDGGLADAIRFLTDKDRITDVAKQATADIEHCLAVAKTAVPNPWGDDDEAIAAEILKTIDERKDGQRSLRHGGSEGHER